MQTFAIGGVNGPARVGLAVNRVFRRETVLRKIRFRARKFYFARFAFAFALGDFHFDFGQNKIAIAGPARPAADNFVRDRFQL